MLGHGSHAATHERMSHYDTQVIVALFLSQDCKTYFERNIMLLDGSSCLVWGGDSVFGGSYVFVLFILGGSGDPNQARTTQVIYDALCLRPPCIRPSPRPLPQLPYLIATITIAKKWRIMEETKTRI